jgi:hypothetical protein
VGRLPDVAFREINVRAPWFAQIRGLPGSPVESVSFDDVSCTVTPRSVHKERRPLFEPRHVRRPVFRLLKVDWSLSARGVWSGLWPADAVVEATAVQEKGRPR